MDVIYAVQTHAFIQRVPMLAVLPQSWVTVQTELILWATGMQRLQKEKVWFCRDMFIHRKGNMLLLFFLR